MNDVPLMVAIREAIKQGDAERVTALIGPDKARLQMMTPFGTWLHVAARGGNLDVVDLLVSLGAHVNALGGILGGGPLNAAASQGHIEIVRYLIAHSAELDADEPERNPLFGAIYGGHTAVARLLIDSGIDVRVNYVGPSGREKTALSFARDHGRDDIVQMLTNAGCVADPVRPRVAAAPSHREILRHMEATFGPVQSLALVEVLPGTVPIAIHVIPPGSGRRQATLFTAGMSDRPMTVPPGEEAYRYAELVIHLPAGWPLTREALGDPAHSWPVMLLRGLATFPHEHATWLGRPPTIVSNGEPPEPYAPGLGFTCTMLLSDITEGSRMEAADGRTILFFTLVPIYTEERDLERKEGLDALFRRLAAHEPGLIVDLDRINVAR